MAGHHTDTGGAESLGEADAAPHQESANGRHKSIVFELLILGELMDGPHHGYLLRDILTRLLGPYRQISWAAIYPLIHRLEREGLIAPEPGDGQAPKPEQAPDRATPSGRQRHHFGITEGGRQRFYALMLQPGEPNAEYRELFTIKLSYLRFLAPDQQRAILAHCTGYLARQRDHLRHVFTAQSTTAHLPHDQREQIFRMMRFRLASVEAELHWAQEELSRLGQGAKERTERDEEPQ